MLYIIKEYVLNHLWVMRGSTVAWHEMNEWGLAWWYDISGNSLYLLISIVTYFNGTAALLTMPSTGQRISS